MLQLAFDENFPIAVSNGLRQRQPSLDVVHVTLVGMRQVPDPDLLDWAAATGRVLVSLDRKTLIRFAQDRIQARLPMPGVVLVRPSLTTGQAIDELELLAMASYPPDLQDLIQFLPI